MKKYKIDTGNFIITPEGYVKVTAKIARIGIQSYLEGQVIDGGSMVKVVNVMRPQDEVFSEDSIESFNNLTLTNNHPEPGAVNSKNWKKYAVGFGGIVKRVGNHLTTDITITDEEAIKAWKSGRKEISNGYQCLDVYEPGEYNGEKYDYVQRQIRGNHIALVDQGRCGPSCRTLDANNNNTGVKRMKIKIDGIEVEFADETTKALVQAALDKRDEKLTVLQIDAGTKAGELEKMKDEYSALKKKIKDMEAEMKDPAKADAAIQTRMNNAEVAKRVMGDDYKWQEKNCTEIKKDCVTKLHPDMKLDNVSDDFLDGLFATVVAAKAVVRDNKMAEMFDSGETINKNDNGLDDYVSKVLNGGTK